MGHTDAPSGKENQAEFATVKKELAIVVDSNDASRLKHGDIIVVGAVF